MFQNGKVILVPFPFTDLAAQKVRPAIIVSSPKYAADTVTVVFVSSVIPKELLATDILLDSVHKHFQRTGLKLTSVIRCHKIATLDKRIVLGEIGALGLGEYRQVKRKLKLLFVL